MAAKLRYDEIKQRDIKHSNGKGHKKKKRKKAAQKPQMQQQGQNRPKQPNPNKNRQKQQQPTPSRKKNRKKIKKQQQIQNSQQNQMQQQNRTKRKRHKKNYIIYYIIFITIAIITLTILSFTVFFNIKSIEILDTTKISQEKIIELSTIKIGDNLLKINIEHIEKNIISNALNIDDVVISRKFPNRLSIKIVESKPKTALKYKSNYYYLSAADRLIEKSDFNSHPELTLINGVDLENITVGDYFKMTDKNNYDLCKEVMTAIKESGLTNVNFINISDLANVRVYYKNLIEIKLGNANNLDYKFKVAKEIINSKLEKDDQGVLDVQISGKSFFRQSEIKIQDN